MHNKPGRPAPGAGSLFATAIDPDGNNVQIIQPSEAHRNGLATTKAFSGFSVNDLDAAKTFYAHTLGLKVTEIPAGLTLHLAGDRPTLVYRNRTISRPRIRSSTSRWPTSMRWSTTGRPACSV